MEGSPSRSRFLDKGQQELQETFQAHAKSLTVAAENRYKESLQIRLAEKLRIRIAERARNNILALSVHLEETANAVPDMSTRSGLVYPLRAPDYLDEELTRLKSLSALLKFDSLHKKALWDDILRYSKNGESLGVLLDYRTEDVVLQHSKDTLKSPINNLSIEEDCRRAGLVLAEVGNRRKGIRRKILASIADTPAQVAYLISVGGAVLGNAVLSLMAAGGSACVQGGGMYALTRSDVANLKQVESDMLTRLKQRHQTHPECVEDSIFAAGIASHPKKVLGLTE